MQLDIWFFIDISEDDEDYYYVNHLYISICFFLLWTNLHLF